MAIIGLPPLFIVLGILVMGKRNSIVIFCLLAVSLSAVSFYFWRSGDTLLRAEHGSVSIQNLSGRYVISEASRNKLRSSIGLADGDSCELELRGPQFTSKKFPVFDMSKKGHILTPLSGNVVLENDQGKAVLSLVFPSAIPSVNNGISLDVYRNRVGTLFLCLSIDDPDDVFQGVFIRE